MLERRSSECWPIHARRRWREISPASGWTCANCRPSTPDLKLFPHFDGNLRAGLSDGNRTAVRQHPAGGPQHPRSAERELHVRERAARQALRHSDIYGSHFRRVTLTDENRRGLLGQGSILTVTSHSDRTSLVGRGKWILDNLLAAPPPPPPPNVSALTAGRARPTGQVLTMRERMLQHRANPVCAGCHARMDPLGFALRELRRVGTVADARRLSAARHRRRAPGWNEVR